MAQSSHPGMRGVNDAVRQIQSKLNRIRRGSARALVEVGLDIMGESARRAPVDIGDLRSSAYMEVNGQPAARIQAGPEGDVNVVGGVPEGLEAGSDVRVRAGFNEVYALPQHEELTWNHPKGGQAKYLESVLVERRDPYVAHVKQGGKGGGAGGG